MTAFFLSTSNIKENNNHYEVNSDGLKDIISSIGDELSIRLFEDRLLIKWIQDFVNANGDKPRYVSYIKELSESSHLLKIERKGDFYYSSYEPKEVFYLLPKCYRNEDYIIFENPVQIKVL